MVSTLEKYDMASNKRTKKGNFKVVFRSERIPNDLIFKVVVGKDIQKFRVKPSNLTALPVHYYGGKMKCIFTQEASSKGAVYSFTLNKTFVSGLSTDVFEKKALESLYKAYQNKFNEFEKDWEIYRGEKLNKNGKPSAQMSVWNNLDHLRKLTSQDPFSGKIAVIYNENGTSIRCGVIKCDGVIFDYETYYYYAGSLEEAHYLAGILNSGNTLELLKKSGILSERHIESKPFELNIPTFDLTNPVHMEISILSKQISESLENGGKLEDSENEVKIGKIEEYVSKLF